MLNIEHTARPFILIAVFCSAFAGSSVFTLAGAYPDAAATLVVYNKNEPRSEEVARHYISRRGVPEKNLCALTCPNREEITRADYNNTILKPVREFVQIRDMIRYGNLPRPDGKGEFIAATTNRLKYIVLCYGMPLKITNDPNEIVSGQFRSLKDEHPEFLINAAAVDSELANLPTPQQPITAFLTNPLYKKTFVESKRWNHRLLCVARLDGPNADIARRLVDDAIETERSGLSGRAFFDMRGLPPSSAAYKLGDDWIRQACKSFEAKGWKVIIDEKETVFGEDMDATDCAVYAGWYTGEIAGPFRAAGFRFRRGAIAYHIHSSSADTLRSSTANWTGPLIARGAAASMGCVYEPYLQMTPNIEVFFERLLEGCSFGEAAYSSQQFLSWMNTVVGDPLYRPFAVPAVTPSKK